MARTQYFSAPTHWTKELNHPKLQADWQAGYDARAAILNGAEWEDYITPDDVNQSYYLAGWNVAEIHHAHNQTPLQALLDEQELSRASRWEYPSIQARHRNRDRTIAEIQTAANIAAAAEETFVLVA